MFCLHVVIGVIAVLGGGLARMELNPNTKELITFDGDELQIEVNNPGGVKGRLTLCVRSSVKSSSDGCPNGYDDWVWFFNVYMKTIRINRQGKVFFGQEMMYTIQSILFKDDTALEVLLAKISPSSVKVTLLNAQRYVPSEPVESITEKEAGPATITVVVIVLLIISVVLTAGMFVLICFCRRTVPSKIQDKDEKQKCKEMNGFGPRRHTFSSPMKSISRQISSPTVPVSPKRSSSVAFAPSEPNTESISPTNAVKQT